jgi:NADH:ubiquinone oxidoreductase subunit E
MVHVKICCGLDCTARGGQELILALESDSVLAGKVKIEYEKCMERCREGDFTPVVEVDDVVYESMTADKLVDLLYAKIGVQAMEEVD